MSANGIGSGTALVRAEAPSPGLAPTRDDGLVMVVSPAEARRRVQELQAFVQEVMVPKVDYATIPGTDKPSLLQPGAQKLAEMYGFAHDFLDEKSVEEWDRGFFFYRRKCVLTSRRDGRYIGSGIGSCNSREDRYAGRWVFENEVPRGLDRNSLRSKEFQKKNGTGSFKKYRIANDDIYSLVNTIEKMACKRAYVGAVVAVTRSAGVFTQDVEDLPDEVYGRPEETRSWEQAAVGSVPEGLFARLGAADSVQALNAIASATVKAHKAGQITDAQLEAIKGEVGRKRAALAKPPDAPASVPATDDGPAYESETEAEVTS